MELHIKTRDRIATVNRRGAARTQHLQHWHNRQEAVMAALRVRVSMTRVEISIRSGVILSREALARHPESRSDERIAVHPRLLPSSMSREAGLKPIDSRGPIS